LENEKWKPSSSRAHRTVRSHLRRKGEESKVLAPWYRKGRKKGRVSSTRHISREAKGKRGTLPVYAIRRTVRRLEKKEKRKGHSQREKKTVRLIISGRRGFVPHLAPDRKTSKRKEKEKIRKPINTP